ncbi:accessory gene regulator ArgB-like protein [Pseudobacteroides cellulosolvens]|uniref:Accessory protein regulator B n=1 Tax=Pseudobacteroides cellulosolvens ATCC 35603 = DSM 2933 TaxID=398512 RepID=A0A0L6JVZ1_9FIRM|nr:accessory gene regulator B family protein [Pseudobacteroides cellulosolvens]KNY30003.1 Accessory protein regulator B [Pseudobacteroides cellulosolvens ATCC 35603 = DSM 2933]
MVIIDILSIKITNLIKSSMDGIDEEKEEVLKYGLDIIIYNTFLLAFFFMSALILGVLKPVVISLIVYGSLRIAAGGAHAKTRTLCFIISVITFYGPVLISKFFLINSLIPSVIIFIMNILAIIVYAPADTLEKPIISKKLRLYQKLSSFVIAIIIFLISLRVYNIDKVIYNVILFSIIPFLLLLSPLGYKLLGCLPGRGELGKS